MLALPSYVSIVQNTEVKWNCYLFKTVSLNPLCSMFVTPPLPYLHAVCLSNCSFQYNLYFSCKGLFVSLEKYWCELPCLHILAPQTTILWSVSFQLCSYLLWFRISAQWQKEAFPHPVPHPHPHPPFPSFLAQKVFGAKGFCHLCYSLCGGRGTGITKLSPGSNFIPVPWSQAMSVTLLWISI